MGHLGAGLDVVSSAQHRSSRIRGAVSAADCRLLAMSTYPEGTFEAKTYDEAGDAMFPAGAPRWHDEPLAAAKIWFDALAAGDFAKARTVCLDPADWDLHEVAGVVNGLVLAQNVEVSTVRRDVAFAKFFHDPGSSGRFTADVDPGGGYWLALVRRDGLWFVFSLTESPRRPKAEDLPSFQ